MHAKEMRQLAEGLLGPALAAARVQMAYFHAGVAVERKADNSPVTAADRESEEILLQALAEISPGVPVIAEEAVTAGHIPDISGAFFLVDPLDGTNGYSKGRPNFTINVGLIIGGRPHFGLVYAPALADFYVTLGPQDTANGKLDPNAVATRLADCDLQPVRTRAPNPDALSALVSHSHLNRKTEQYLERYAVVDKRAIGSSLKFGLLARGEADLYPRIGETSEWDTAAGHAILAAAGGSVVTVAGDLLLYGRSAPRFVNPDFVAWGRWPPPPRR
jgi:3'(2'), 5'-bisphosphate nucleotidase